MPTDAAEPGGTKPRADSMWRGLLASPTTRSAALFGFTGIGFSGAHLILAKILEPAEYGLIALVVAILMLAQPLASLGATGIVLRRQWTPDVRLLVRTTVTCVLVGAVLAVSAGRIYGLSLALASWVCAGVATAGIMEVAAATLQSRQRFVSALLLSQSGNWLLLLASFALLILGRGGAELTLAVIVVGYTVLGAGGWAWILRRASGRPDRAYPWREALAFVFVSGAGPVLGQVERLFIPTLLSLEDLATFGVLAAIVLAPFRTLQMGATFTTVPRMRAAATVADRRQLLIREAGLLLTLIALGAVVLTVVTPWIVDLIYQDKYPVTHDLVWATIALGIAKAYGGLAKGTAVAVCTTREMARLGVLVWLGVAVSVAGAAVGASWGLTGLLLGIMFGWIAMQVAYLAVAWPHLR